MPGFTSMSERHAFGLEALAEMTGKLLQAAYLRASRPVDPEDQDRAILLFDRLGRGFRLTLALEARLERERRREAAGLDAPAPAAARETPAQETPPPALPSSATAPRASRPPQETDSERDLDLEAADLTDHVRDLRRVVAEDADILDPDGAHGATLDRWAGAWGDVLRPTVRPADDGAEAALASLRGAPASAAPARLRTPRRASG